jgi:glycosyltransferase involved in cell wall biosynthesis
MHKIAISANSSWYIYNFRKNTILALTTLGYQVIVLAPQDQYSEKLSDLGCDFLHVYIDQSGINPFKEVKTIYKLWKVYREYSIDIVLNFTPKNNIYSTLSAYLAGTGAINNISGLGVVFVNNNMLSAIVRYLYRISQKRASKIFFQNADDQKMFSDLKIAHNVPSERLPGSGVDLTRFKVSPAPDDGVVRFILVARMLYEKGIEQYVESARRLKEKYGVKVELNLLGFLNVNNPSAISSSQMNSCVDEGIVNYLGVSDCVENQIAYADCVVLPSYYQEGVPRSLLEAGAMGKPLITCDSVGCRDCVVDSVNGYLCQPRSADSLFSKMQLIYKLSHEDRISMGLKSREKIEAEFNEKFVIERYVSSIKDCLNG